MATTGIYWRLLNIDAEGADILDTNEPMELEITVIAPPSIYLGPRYQYWTITNANPPWETYKNKIEQIFISDQISPLYCKTWFDECVVLTTIYGLNRLDTSNVNNMNGMFYNCQALTALNLSNFNTSKVTDMSSMFYGCQSLETLDLSNFSYYAVTTTSHMFQNCSSLKELDIGDFESAQLTVTDISYMFAGCSSLGQVLDPEDPIFRFNIPTNYITNMSHLFDGCSVLFFADVTIEFGDSLTNTSYMFQNCFALTSLHLNMSIEPEDGINITNMSGMFKNCSSLTNNINILQDFNTSSVTDMSKMFYGCQALTTLNVSNFNTSKVTNMGHMFYGCQALTTLNVSNFNTSKVTNMGYMFYGCASLTSLDLSNFNISKVTIMSYMFYGCTNLNKIYFPLIIGTANPNIISIFLQDNNQHYLMNKGTTSQSVISYWQYIASLYLNVHYEFDDNSLPIVSNLSVIRVNSSGSTTYISNGTYAYLKFKANVFSNYLPNNYVNSFKNITIEVDGSVASITPIYNSSIDYYEAWINFNNTDRHSFSVSANDSITLNNVEVKSRTGLPLEYILSKAFALVDYYHELDSSNPNYGFEGMSIGKFATEANLFDVDMSALFRDTVKVTDHASVVRLLFDFIYPVGSYYETSDTTFDPNVTWGGTWELEVAGQVHVSSGTGYTVNGAETNTTDGGAPTVTLNTTMIPAHTHGAKLSNGSIRLFKGNQVTTASGSISFASKTNRQYQADGTDTNSWQTATFALNHTHDSVGGGQPHENMPPYIIVNRWHRTA